jgi:hypothetical protein
MYRWEGDGDLASLDAATEPVLGAFEALDDDEGIIRILLLRGSINGDHFELAAGYLERALALAERTGDRKAAALAASTLGMIAVFGPLTASEGIDRCRSSVARSRTTGSRGPGCSATRRCCTQCRVGSTMPKPTKSSMTSAAPWCRPTAGSGAGRSSGSPEHRSAPKPRHARALSSSAQWAPRATRRLPPRCWPSRPRHSETPSRSASARATSSWPPARVRFVKRLGNRADVVDAT